MVIQAFAKINWSLDITGVREDGYHLMDMLMQPVSLADEITLEPAGTLSISTGGYPPSRADETNLAWRAAAALKKATGYPGGVSIHVQKSIPIGAGMGGGSSDAAGEHQDCQRGNKQITEYSFHDHSPFLTPALCRRLFIK